LKQAEVVEGAAMAVVVTAGVMAPAVARCLIVVPCMAAVSLEGRAMARAIAMEAAKARINTSISTSTDIKKVKVGGMRRLNVSNTMISTAG